jgi:hypothetical protein
VLGQAVEGGGERRPGLDGAGLGGPSSGGALDEFEGVRRHADEPADGPRRVAATAGPLQQSGDALRAADLQDLLHRTEVHAEIEARRGDHALHPARPQARLGPRPQVAVHRPVMQGERLLPVGPGRRDRLEPALGLRAGVREHERGRGSLDRRHDLRQEPHAHVAGPREPFHRLGDQGLDLEGAGHAGGDEPGRGHRGRADERRERVVEVRERGRQAPGRDPRPQGPEPGEGEFRLHAPLRREQFVPLVDDHGLEVGEDLVGVLEREQDRERLGRGHERRRPPGAEPPPVGGRRVARADTDGQSAGHAARAAERFLKGERRVGRERLQRRDPGDARAAARGGRRGTGLRVRDRSEPGGEGLAGAGRGVDEAALAGRRRLPDLLLERKHLPAPGREPAPKPVDGRSRGGVARHRPALPPPTRLGRNIHPGPLSMPKNGPASNHELRFIV